MYNAAWKWKVNENKKCRMMKEWAHRRMEPFVKVRCQFFGWCAIKNAILNWKCSYTNAFFAPVCEHATRARCVWCDAGRFVSPTELSMPFIIRCFFFALGASYFLIFIEMREFVIGAPSNDGDFNQWNWWLALEKCDLISMLFFVVVGCELKTCYIVNFIEMIELCNTLLRYEFNDSKYIA